MTGPVDGIELDLRAWLEDMRARDLVHDVSGAHWKHEIGALTDLNAKRGKRVLLFDDIPDYVPGQRIVTGALLDAERVARALAITGAGTDRELVRALRERLRHVHAGLRGGPGAGVVERADGPVLSHTVMGDDVDLYALPAPIWHQRDGGRYLGTFDVVVTRDPVDGWVNLGTYRSMVHDRNHLCLFVNAGHHGGIHVRRAQERGEPAPVAISLGHHPLLATVSGLEVASGVSEYEYASRLVGQDIEVVEAPVTGLPVPAHSEIVIEGYVTDEAVDEGPYGEFIGYYAGGKIKTPTIEVAAIHHRPDPIMLGTCAGIPPYDYSYFRCPFRGAMIWESLEQAGVPGVTGVWAHEAGYSRGFNIVAIEQAYRGHARQAGFLAAQVREGIFAGKFTVVVDDDIDPTNIDEVLWAMASRTDPSESIEFIKHSWGMSLDPMVERAPGQPLSDLPMSRAIVDACRPFSRHVRGEFPEPVTVDPDLAERLLAEHADLFER